MTSGIAFTPEEMEQLKKQILSIMIDGTHVPFMAACKGCGVSKSVAYEWRTADPEFDKAVGAAQRWTKETGLDFAETVLMKKIRKEETAALLFYLKTQGKERGYIEKTVVAGDQENPVQHNHRGRFTLTFGTEDNDGDDDAGGDKAPAAPGDAVGPA